ncbi:MAG: glycosyltransferase family 2 protein [Pseudomonadota bacterium]
MRPTLSIIIPSYNQGHFIEKTLLSVFAQMDQNTEVIFVDGGSTDQTLSIAEKYRDMFSYFVSEKDRGQSDALIKGVQNSEGRFLTWLNTDDMLLPGALANFRSKLSNHPGTNWFFGNVIWIDDKDTVLRVRRGESFSHTFGNLGRLTACGPSAFFSRELYENVGGFDRDFHYKMDTQLWWKFFLSGERFVRLDKYIWALRLHKDAKMSGHHFSDQVDEISRARQKVEASSINLMRTGGSREEPSHVEKVAGAVISLLSPNVNRSRWDELFFKGKSLSELEALK